MNFLTNEYGISFAPQWFTNVILSKVTRAGYLFVNIGSLCLESFLVLLLGMHKILACLTIFVVEVPAVMIPQQQTELMPNFIIRSLNVLKINRTSLGNL